jgi:hypothetical protein
MLGGEKLKSPKDTPIQRWMVLSIEVENPVGRYSLGGI